MKLYEMIRSGQMPVGFTLMSNGQLIPASSMVGLGGIPGFPGSGLAGSAPVPAANYPPSILPSPSGGSYTHFNGMSFYPSPKSEKNGPGYCRFGLSLHAYGRYEPLKSGWL